MPSINFTVFIDKIISGEKNQTIRPIGKQKYKPGDKLCLYKYRTINVRGREKENANSKI